MSAMVAVGPVSYVLVDLDPAPDFYEVVSLTGRVMARTTDASDDNWIGVNNYAASIIGAAVRPAWNGSEETNNV